MAKSLAVHGWVYGIRDGLIRDLGMSMSRAEDSQGRYASAVGWPRARRQFARLKTLPSDSRHSAAQGLKRKNLPWVHDVQGIERLLDLTHDADRLAVFGGEEFHFAEADAVFSGTSAVHRQGAMNQALVKSLGFCEFLRVVAIDKKPEMKIPVADMADQWGDQKTAS